MMKINYVTTNAHKFEVAQHFFASEGLADVVLSRSDVETPEIQADSVEDVAKNSAKWVAQKLGTAVVVGDAGLSIAALGGFPGPYMKYMNQTLSVSDLLLLMSDKSDRSATFVDCLAFYDPDSDVEPVTFLSTTEGAISDSAAAAGGSTVDSLFVPAGWNVPLADIERQERAKVWNTDRWRRLVEHLKSIGS
ncbi:non-canonical purine NTP pyrophosphatase [Nocardia sputorum]|uniref:non-canonical purine NTP pyrophosphatase n=1 Tax=Nocardia TaxID=1817 RepID=UPI002453B541|nr:MULTISPECIES: non-canonical purine NTP pyrophosphatase [Nocardia]BDT94143.1 non-canonical purine NTP pyrophosphatase [Nocardia sputorum]